MQPVLNNVSTNFGQVVSGITIPDISFGVAGFDDYPYGTFGLPSFGDKPFYLTQQVTTDTAAVQSALAALTLHNGADLPESTMEALYQAATGRGYDQNCDNSYDSALEVPPFLPSASGPTMDAFAGSVSGIYDPTVPGTGDIGGVGFRANSVPIIVYASDAELRDPLAGYGVPPICGDPAGTNEVVSALAGLGAQIIGIGTDATPVPQMTDLAAATGSLADLDGDGTPDPLVFEGVSSTVVTSVIAGIEAIANNGTFDLTLEVYDAPYNFVTDIQPAVFPDVQVGTEVIFSITLYPDVAPGGVDQVFVFDMSVIGDGVSVLATWQLVLLVLAG